MRSLLNWLLSPKSPRRAAGYRPASCSLAVECLGGAGGSLMGRRLDRSFRPSYEQLEERQMLSASGTISVVSTPYDNVSYAIGTDSQLYETMGPRGTAYTAPWSPAVPGRNVKLTQISAGMREERDGSAVCWGIEQRTNNVWLFMGGRAYSTHGAFTQISATMNHWCYAIASDHSVYRCNVYDQSWIQLTRPNEMLATQVSAGEDCQGRSIAYVSAQSNHVYELRADGAHVLCPFQATQISVGVGTNRVVLDSGLTVQTDESLYYVSAGDGLIHHWLGAGREILPDRAQVAGVYTRISAGVDRYGHDEVFAQDYAHYVRKWDERGFTFTGGQTDEIAAASDDFVLGTAPGSHALLAYGGRQWFYTNGTAIGTSINSSVFSVVPKDTFLFVPTLVPAVDESRTPANRTPAADPLHSWWLDGLGIVVHPGLGW